ncbi:hypothetical protein AGMMS49545_05510 [Betaproteobacteria bacterium]|nr:hypothetical protein AGMMS49545_05510 [Betaproteobacteria bacterium]GHU42907.1 hypothetical protein AGMMS50289_08410 [Betaproteobacteria bacterium]
MTDKRNLLVAALTLGALVLMLAAYFAPIWWVSLTAPNYPPEAFPDGIRIHFHFDRVANGCTAAAQGTRMAKEIIQKDLSGDDERYNPITDTGGNLDQKAEGLDCVHEMNTINHYVGMFPIETGAPVERPLAKFFFGFFAVMLLAFALPRPKGRVFVLSVGFLALFVWMMVDQFVLGHLEQQVQHYMLETGSFFKEPERIQAWGNTVLYASVSVIVGLVLAMIIVVLGTLKIRSFQLLLAFVPALLPIFFVFTYAGWLWFFGHNLHPWGAFTVKPFMPTVFGEGKVAQFSTFSYPTWGFALLVLVFVCLMLAALIRRKQLREGGKS